MSKVYDFYQANAARYQQFLELIRGDFKDFRDLEKRLLLDISASKVYYVGAGESSNVIILIGGGNKVLGIDFSENMLNESRKNLSCHSINYRQIPLSENQKIAPEFLDRAFSKMPAVLVHGDARDIILPPGYFDVSVIYCTLPNMTADAQSRVVETMKSSSRRVLISIYKPESLDHVLSVYQEMGEKGEVTGETLKLENGLVYKIVGESELKRFFVGWKLMHHSHPFGVIYDFKK